MGCCLTGAMRRHRSLCNYNFSMCGRYRLKHVERLAERFEAIYCGNNEEIVPRYNIAPTQPIPVIRATESGREITSIRWGLIPSWGRTHRLRGSIPEARPLSKSQRSVRVLSDGAV